MKLSTLLLISISILAPTLAQAKTTDWTNMIQPMLNSCGHIDMKRLTPSQKASIANKKVTQDKETSSTKTTYFLKNANAFGYPLKSITIEVSYEPYERVTFSNSQFMSLESRSTNNDPYNRLSFEKSSNSIQCSGNDDS